MVSYSKMRHIFLTYSPPKTLLHEGIVLPSLRDVYDYLCEEFTDSKKYKNFSCVYSNKNEHPHNHYILDVAQSVRPDNFRTKVLKHFSLKPDDHPNLLCSQSIRNLYSRRRYMIKNSRELDGLFWRDTHDHEGLGKYVDVESPYVKTISRSNLISDCYAWFRAAKHEEVNPSLFNAWVKHMIEDDYDILHHTKYFRTLYEAVKQKVEQTAYVDWLNIEQFVRQ